MAGNIIDVTDEDFDAEVLEADGFVFVFFHRADCETCEELDPVFKQLAREFKGQLTFVMAGDENAPDAHRAWSVDTYPHLSLFEDGAEVEICTGDDPDEIPDLVVMREFLTGHVGDVGARDEFDDEGDEEEPESGGLLGAVGSSYGKRKTEDDEV